MKKHTLLSALAIACIFFVSCSKTPQQKAESAVKSYLKEHLKNAAAYESLSYTELDTLGTPDTSEDKKISAYAITNHYVAENSEKEKVKMSVTFYLDNELKVNTTNIKSIDGNPAVMTGNVYWKYNDYVGNKPDAGAEVWLYALDSVKGNLKYESTADVSGSYRIEKVQPGYYFLVIRSKNTTACPYDHLQNFSIYSHRLKQLFGFNIYDKFRKEIEEADRLDSSYIQMILAGANKDYDDPYFKQYGDYGKYIDAYKVFKNQRDEKAVKILESLPQDFKDKIKFLTPYSYSYDFSTITIESDKVANEVTDFGITCVSVH